MYLLIAGATTIAMLGFCMLARSMIIHRRETRALRRYFE